MEPETSNALHEVWARWVRGSALRKGTKRYKNEGEAYIQGALTALHAEGRMSVTEVNRTVMQAAISGVDTVLDPNRKIKHAQQVPRRRGSASGTKAGVT